MINAIKILWHRNKLLLIAFTIASLLTIVFAVRTVVFSIYWGDPDHQNQALALWMTPQYVAYSYKLDPEKVAAAFGLNPDKHRRITVKEIIGSGGPTLEQMQSNINTLAAQPRND